jgi:hypothetical protein
VAGAVGQCAEQRDPDVAAAAARAAPAAERRTAEAATELAATGAASPVDVVVMISMVMFMASHVLSLSLDVLDVLDLLDAPRLAEGSEITIYRDRSRHNTTTRQIATRQVPAGPARSSATPTFV